MIGTSVGDRYHIIDQIGEGGMAFVYMARDQKLDRRVAIKVLHSQFLQHSDVRQRFLQEAKAISALSHPNIVQIYDYSGSNSKQLWIVTELIHGETLGQWVRKLPKMALHPIIAACIVRETCRALAMAHSKGIIHRDVKPENVMLTMQGKLKLMDFGISKHTSNHSMTQTGAFMGSPSYMSPEQIHGKDIDLRADIYSLTVLFYEILCGQLPFSGKTTHEVVMRICEGQFEPPCARVIGLPAELNRLIVSNLSLSPQNRSPNIQQYASELDSFLFKHGFIESHVELERFFHDPKGYSQKLARVPTRAKTLSPPPVTFVSLDKGADKSEFNLEQATEVSTRQATPPNLPPAPPRPPGAETSSLERPVAAPNDRVHRRKTKTVIKEPGHATQHTRSPELQLQPGDRTLQIKPRQPKAPDGNARRFNSNTAYEAKASMTRASRPQRGGAGQGQAKEERHAPSGRPSGRRKHKGHGGKRRDPQPSQYERRAATRMESKANSEGSMGAIWTTAILVGLLLVAAFFYRQLGDRRLLSEGWQTESWSEASRKAGGRPVGNRQAESQQAGSKLGADEARPKSKAGGESVGKSMGDSVGESLPSSSAASVPANATDQQNAANQQNAAAEADQQNLTPREAQSSESSFQSSARSSVQSDQATQPEDNTSNKLPQGTKRPAPKAPSSPSQSTERKSSQRPESKTQQATQTANRVGRLWISSTPAADIYINGKMIGTTVDRTTSSGFIRLRSGQYRLELRRQGYQSLRRRIQISTGKDLILKQQQLKKTQAHFTLNLRVSPTPAELTINNQEAGTSKRLRMTRSPLALSLPGGRYTVFVTYRGITRRRVVVLPGRKGMAFVTVKFDGS